MRIDPLLTRSPVSGAVRHVTDDLLAEVYLAPRAAGLVLKDALGGGTAPWSASFAAAPDETARAVEAGLIAVARATPHLDPDDLEPALLPESRARTHMQALRDLWRDLGALPGPLDTWRHVLRSTASEALEPLPLIGPDCPFASPAETALARPLGAHHGRLPAQQAPEQAPPGTAYRHLQDTLGRRSDRVPPDASLACHGLRDPREEAEFAAARARTMLDDGTVSAARDIGLLAPDEPSYGMALAEAFDRVGLPLAGRPAQPVLRDDVGELLSLLLVLLQGHAPRTALASLYVAPVMPWPRDTGLRMARELMERGWSRTASELTGAAREVLKALRPYITPEQLFARLGVVARAAPCAALQPRIAALRAVAQDTLDWPLLRRLASPRMTPAEGADRFVEGVSLFAENALPWRPVRQLIVLGLAGRHWPRLPGADPFFTEGEIEAIRATGLALPGRQQKLARGLELFRRQLGAGTEGLTLLVPALDLRGDRLTPSTGLALMAHMLGAKDPADLVQDIRSAPPDSWPVAVHVPDPVALGGAPDLPETGLIHLQAGLGTPDQPGRDLLDLRRTPEGQPLPHSPSRLETLLVSPLAWLLGELGARDRTWAPEALDVMTLGTLMHQVLEEVFAEGVPVPDSPAIAAMVPDALDAAIRRHAAWLAEPAWATERRSLLREALEVCTSWAGFLRDVGAQVLHNEITLQGDHGGLLLHGKADCLLRLPDGRILVVDHKRSGAAGRRDRMSKGWDLQVALYRAMLERPSAETALTRLVAQGAQVITAYHMLRDGTVLSDARGADVPRIETTGQDASVRAMDHLADVLAEVGAGTIRLNRTGDAKTFEKERGLRAYALDDPLVAAFSLPETLAEDAE
ncbi:PD-(D/E)XK nuclease family protein [Maliponia aquimaris]|uniref:PD-(D/E)XK nuclease superfamily protein n=1 Tax=Maliponia aquimaris TaxID=1673631 RepID=A0A238KNK8_9RHOB|nr:PD-(D/E)XK nuclease family protein [Maliponia aquimaris]SMX44434.1 PD-(D/E)XK nuclease superfamily protein [Maliponia aquimaris]